MASARTIPNDSPPRRRGAEHVGRGVVGGQVGLGHRADEDQVGPEPGRDHGHRLVPLVPVVAADHQQAQPGEGRLEPQERPDQVGQALAGLEPADEQHRRAVALPALQRLGAGEELGRHPVGDDRHGPAEVALPGVAGRGADRDPAGQPVVDPAQQRAGRLQGQGAAQVGVEGPHHRDPGPPGPRQQADAGRQRLVDVEQVVAAPPHGPADPGQGPGADGDAGHRAVVGHGQRPAEADEAGARPPAARPGRARRPGGRPGAARRPGPGRGCRPRRAPSTRTGRPGRCSDRRRRSGWK